MESDGQAVNAAESSRKKSRSLLPASKAALAAVRISGRKRCSSSRKRLGLSANMPLRFRSEEHTSELQSRFDLVCRLLLEKKKKQTNTINKEIDKPRL